MSALPAAFHRLAGSNLAAQFSEQIALAAAPLVAVLAMDASGAETGMLQAAQTLPFLLLSLPAGVLADRTSRSRLMVGAEALRAVSLLSILALLAAGALDLPLLAALGALGAVGTVAYNVAAPALLPTMVVREGLAAANGRLELARSAAFAAGPALGGAIVGALGAPAAYVAAVVLSLLAVVLLSGLREAKRPPAMHRHPLRELKDGAGFVAGHALLRPILVTAVFFNLAWFVLQSVYVPYAVHRLGLGPAGVGVTLGIYGAGMVAGALAATRIARRVSFGTMIALGPLVALGAALLMALTLVVPSPVFAGCAFFLFGAGPILWTIATTTLRQAVSPPAMLGRVSAVIMTATMGARPLGAVIGAAVAARFGIEACLLVSAAGFLVQALVIVGSPVPRLAVLPAAG